MSSSSGKTVDVLIGSPRNDFWESIKSILKGYYPYKLQQFRSVDEILENPDTEFKPILALIDGQDGTQNVIEWVQATKMNYPDCPLLVLHSAAAPLDFSIVRKNGADELMHLNFDREFISDMILRLAPIDMEGDQIPITALMPVDLRDIEAGININFDVFAHLPANHRSVLLRKAGDVIDDRQIEKFNNLKQQMYVKKTQTQAFFEYARTVMSMRNTAFPISMTEKFHRSKKTIFEFMAQFLNGSSNDYQEGKIIYEKCKSIISDLELTKDLAPNEIYEEVCRYTGNLRTYYHDCLCVSAYTAYFAQLLDWDAAKRESAAVAGLLHNIGLAQLPPSAGDKIFANMTPEEQIQYQRYPDRSVNMVKNKKVPLSVEISEAIGQHREYMNGKGFPHGLVGKDISDLGKLLGLAYAFHEATALQEGKQSKTAVQAITDLREFSITGNGEYDLIMTTQIFKKLKA